MKTSNLFVITIVQFSVHVYNYKYDTFLESLVI